MPRYEKGFRARFGLRGGCAPEYGTQQNLHRAHQQRKRGEGACCDGGSEDGRKTRGDDYGSRDRLARRPRLGVLLLDFHGDENGTFDRGRITYNFAFRTRSLA